MTSFGFAIALLLLQQQQPTRDDSAAALLTRAIAADAAQQSAAANFAYAELQENWNNAGGEPLALPHRTRRYENLFVEGRPYQKLIEVNGRSLNAAEQKKVDEDIARTAKQRREERRSKGRMPFLPGTRKFGIGTLKELAPLLDFRIAGEANVAGHPAVILEGRPKPDIEKLHPRRGAELACYVQRFWIHVKENVVLRREVDVVRKGAELLPGTTLHAEYARALRRECRGSKFAAKSTSPPKSSVFATSRDASFTPSRTSESSMSNPPSRSIRARQSLRMA